VSVSTARYVERLLALVGRRGAFLETAPDPRQEWAESGAMSLTGWPDGPALAVAGPAVAMRGALLALSVLAPHVTLPGLELLGERAAISGLTRRGSTSCGGGTRMVPALDGVVALTLSRQEDVELVPALVEAEVGDPWSSIATWLQGTASADARDRAVLLGLPCSIVGERAPGDPWTTSHEHEGPVPERPLVVNLAPLWAGPLCASMLGMLGSRVVKVEDPRRPDGARRGPRAFFDLLNAGSSSVSVDLAGSVLRDLLARADVVIEGSRPRALRNVGIDVEAWVEEHDVTWVSITGHGRDQDRVGFGDDAAAAGGLVAAGCFLGDAIADPLTGIHAALAAWAGVLQGGGRLIDVSLAGVAASAAGCDSTIGSWIGPVAKPRARSFRGSGPELA
jgi:hypothetical protein